ncbi:MAG: DapH/DapD/GlmU-related protein [Nanoarchaeota archaeon]
MIAKTAIIHPNVELGEGTTVEDYCIIGVPPRGASSGELKTCIGRDSVIRSHTIIYAGNMIGERFQTGNMAFVRESNTIGNDVSIGTHSEIQHHVIIHDNVRIHSKAFIPEYTTLGKGCWIGPAAVITNAKHPNSPRAKEHLSGPIIEAGAKVGANATILPGVKIGAGALVGSGSVVTKDVDAHTVVAGNPARAIKKVDDLRNPDGTGAYQ